MLLFEKIRFYFIRRMLQSRKTHPIYIVPTADGLKVLGLNFLLLVIGLIYANNYVLLFNFFIFCLALGSMFYTHFNLRGMRLVFSHVQNGHANEGNLLSLNFSSQNLLGHDRILVSVYHDELDGQNKHMFSYPPRASTASVQLALSFKKRGEKTLHHIGISTEFPLGFFKAFTFFSFSSNFICYPERIDSHLSLVENIGGLDREESDTELKKYLIGDSLKRVDWKRLAKSKQWLTKSLVGEDHLKVYINIAHNESNIETVLKQAAFSISEAEINGIDYGLKLNDTILIEPNKGTHHQEKCLLAISLL